MQKLPIIFRAERSGDFKGDVTAVFPTEPGTNQFDFTVYAHVGQHGAGCSEWYRGTRAAKPAEYAPLLRELTGIYDDCELQVRSRFPSDAYAQRCAAMKGF